MITAILLFVLALVAPTPKVKKIVLIDPTVWVCAPYPHGRSCKPADDVTRYLLGNARDDCP